MAGPQFDRSRIERALRAGDSGERVALLQRRLATALGEQGPQVDGVLGPATEAALAEFRSSRGLPEHDVVDSALWHVLAVVAGDADDPGRFAWSFGGGVTAVTFSPDGESIATAGEDGTVRLWDAFTGEQLVARVAHSPWAWSVAFSPDGSRIASSGGDGAIQPLERHEPGACPGPDGARGVRAVRALQPRRHATRQLRGRLERPHLGSRRRP